MTQAAPTNFARHARVLTYALVCLCLVVGTARVLPVLGTSEDEAAHVLYGEQIYRLYRSGFTEHSVTSDPVRGRYGGVFDGLSAVIVHALHLTSYQEQSVARHALIAICGLIAMVYAARLASALAGGWAGLICFIMLAMTPTWVGHAWMNCKDIPFAAGYVATVYYVIKLVDSEAATARRFVAFGIALGCCIGVRVGGVALALLSLAAITMTRRRLSDLKYIALAGIIATAIVVAFWPFVAANPLRLFTVLRQTAHFDWGGVNFFNGRFFPAREPIPQYLPTWFAITAPPQELFAIVIAVAIAWTYRRRWREAAPFAFVLIAALALPLFAIVCKSTVYDGVRQFLFVLPLLSVLCACALAALMSRSERVMLCASLVLALTMLEPVHWLLSATPYQYVYFNFLVGGLKGASWKFETDYWSLGQRRAAAWLDEHERTGEKSVITIRTNTPWPVSVAPFLQQPSPFVVVDNSQPSDLELIGSRYRDPDTLMDDNGLLYRDTIVAGQVPFFVIRTGSAPFGANHSRP